MYQMISCNHKDSERVELQRLLQEYLDKGGAITVCPSSKRSRKVVDSKYYITPSTSDFDFVDFNKKRKMIGEGSYQKGVPLNVEG